MRLETINPVLLDDAELYRVLDLLGLADLSLEEFLDKYDQSLDSTGEGLMYFIYNHCKDFFPPSLLSLLKNLSTYNHDMFQSVINSVGLYLQTNTAFVQSLKTGKFSDLNLAVSKYNKVVSKYGKRIDKNIIDHFLLKERYAQKPSKVEERFNRLSTNLGKSSSFDEMGGKYRLQIPLACNYSVLLTNSGHLGHIYDHRKKRRESINTKHSTDFDGDPKELLFYYYLPSIDRLITTQDFGFSFLGVEYDLGYLFYSHIRKSENFEEVKEATGDKNFMKKILLFSLLPYPISIQFMDLVFICPLKYWESSPYDRGYTKIFNTLTRDEKPSRATLDTALTYAEDIALELMFLTLPILEMIHLYITSRMHLSAKSFNFELYADKINNELTQMFSNACEDMAEYNTFQTLRLELSEAIIVNRMHDFTRKTFPDTQNSTTGFPSNSHLRKDPISLTDYKTFEINHNHVYSLLGLK